MHFYRKLNLKPIPKSLLDILVIEPHNYVEDIGMGHAYLDAQGQSLLASSYRVDRCPYEKNPEFMEWLGLQLPGNVRSNWLQQTSAARTPGQPHAHLAHTDRVRRVAINYIIDTGGDNVITSWYRERGQSLHRPYKAAGEVIAGRNHIEYSDLELLESVQFEANSWYMIQTDVIHDVQNITSNRVSLTGNFDNFWCNYFRQDIFSRTED